MEEIILISYLNDFIFCPASIYFHKLYGSLEKSLYNREYQINGINAHKAVDNQTYSTKQNILQGIDVYCEEFNILGKIDILDIDKKMLIERKNKVTKLYDGFIFQVFAQYYALKEMGYEVKKIRIHSMQDNKNYNIKIPSENKKMDTRFRQLINDINQFDLEKFKQENKEKCAKCIYEPSCDRSLLC